MLKVHVSQNITKLAAKNLFILGQTRPRLTADVLACDALSLDPAVTYTVVTNEVPKTWSGNAHHVLVPKRGGGGGDNSMLAVNIWLRWHAGVFAMSSIAARHVQIWTGKSNTAFCAQEKLPLMHPHLGSFPSHTKIREQSKNGFCSSLFCCLIWLH